ncbi:CsbD family protein [Shinella sp.]|uniref:CsbD family protein n=1 Tax=Shinella sp. TaxID=1870904 RepID=UPI003D2B69E2
MSSTGDKASGLANEAIGNIKQGVGKLVGSEKLQAEGKVQEIKGEAQQAMGDAKDAAKKGANSALDYINKKL